jgi:hypothetical protein
MKYSKSSGWSQSSKRSANVKNKCKYCKDKHPMSPVDSIIWINVPTKRSKRRAFSSTIHTFLLTLEDFEQCQREHQQEQGQQWQCQLSSNSVYKPKNTTSRVSLLRFNNIFIRPGNVKYCENVFSDTV